MNEEEFKEFYWSLTDEERIELNRQFAVAARENREAFNLTEEFVNEYDKKNERFAKLVEQKKQAKELLHKVETQMDLATQRIEARILDRIEHESTHFFDDDKKHKPH